MVVAFSEENGIPYRTFHPSFIVWTLPITLGMIKTRDKVLSIL
jgi:hypothetical protein